MVHFCIISLGNTSRKRLFRAFWAEKCAPHAAFVLFGAGIYNASGKGVCKYQPPNGGSCATVCD